MGRLDCRGWCLVFTVNKKGCVPVRSGAFGPGVTMFRRAHWTRVANRWEVSLAFNGFRSWDSPRLPLSSSFLPPSKRHTFHLAASSLPQRKSDSWPPIKLLAITSYPLTPTRDVFPSPFLRFFSCNNTRRGFPGNLRK